MKTKAKRVTCAILSAAMMFGNVSSGITAFAIDANSPINADGTTPNGNKPQDITFTEGAYVNDTPLRLQISKVKTAPGEHEGIAPENTEATQKNTITYKVSGRIDGSESDIIKNYGSEYVELAYSNSGIYLGYGWLRGTFEYLLNRQAQNLDEEIQILYNGYGIFEGYAYITHKLETADDTNRYVAGATMGLYDAVEIFRDPQITADTSYYGEDERFAGVTVIRDSGSNNVTSVYANKGYAGTQIMYVLQKTNGEKIEIDKNGTVINKNYDYQDEINDKGNGTWIAKTIQREDTPILFYSLDKLCITTNDVYTSISSENQKMINDTFGADRYDKDGQLFGFDKEGNVVDITQKNERDFSIFAFEAGTSRPVYEFVGGNFNEICYSMPEKVIEIGADTVIYHLDADGNRDSMVDPQTGIAYIEESITPPEGHNNIHDVNDTESTQNTKIFVWPVNVFYDGSGANSGNSNGSMTFRKIMTTRIATINADTKDEFTTGTFNGSALEKNMNPVLDQYGHPVYYRQSTQTYEKGADTYDYDGDEYTGYIYKDSLDAENENAYTVNDHDTLYNGDKDDPFNQETHYQFSDKQAVRLTVDMIGNFIINGSSLVPVPVRQGYVFAGWLMDPNQLTDKCTVKAYWKNQNSSGMSDDEKEEWYSGKQAESADIKNMTVTFDANGGEFRSGSGDIHSTDNVLYRRLGDAYLMENVWVTGENTPNDPFDTQLVDTIGNTAAGSNTITLTGKTANDAYTATMSGGQADMLKRVNAGTYIMEELKAPAGYVKGLPVGVTVNENAQVQYAEMTDKTIKAEFIKVDATSSYTKNLYLNGELQRNDAGALITVIEPKGNWSYQHVAGAVLALKGKDTATKKAFSDWVKVTNHPQIQKKTEDGYHYFEFTTDVPLYIEGIPAGKYVISETTVPAGYVKTKDQDVVISKTDGVQLFSVDDDHVKVEIEKYYNGGSKNQNLPNAYRAGLALLDANQSTIATWLTDDISDYTNSVADTATASLTLWEKITNLFTSEPNATASFIDLFTDKVNEDKNLSLFSWTITREAVKASYSTDEKETWIISDGSRIVCENQSTPNDAPQMFKDAYNTRNLEANSFTYSEVMSIAKDTVASKTMSDQVWNVSNGTKMHISVYGDNAQGENGRQTYLVDFNFNYRNDYAGSYGNTISYDTVDGRHRFDYLPEGTYTLREITTPEGFVTAADKVLTVLPNGDIQRFTLENKRKQLLIAKIAQKDNIYYAGTEDGVAVENADITASAVIAGAKLSLYFSENQIAGYENAFTNGNIPANTKLADAWTSGSDGKYTESDYKAELIRKDQIGDYKPHTVTDIANGWYYLVESETPAYYKTFSIKEIHVTDKTTSDALTEIQAVNTPIPMEVRVYKRNNENSPLAGAVFSVKNQTLGGIDVGTLSTDGTGTATLVVTDTGRFIADGNFEPYTFTIQEVSAPVGYKLDNKIHEFIPSPAHHGIVTIMENTADSDIVNGILYVTNEPSEITISKADFSDGAAVPGTKLAVYKAEYKDNRWLSTMEQSGDDWTWIIENNQITHSVTGLAAGQVYVLTEESVPKGYTKASDIFFKVASNGASIEKIWHDPEANAYMTFATDSAGAVESVTFSTRTIVGTYVTLKNMSTGTEANKGALTGGIVNLSSNDVVDGTRYTLKEYVKYSDGNVDCLGTTTFIAKLYINWMKIDLNKDIQNLSIGITNGDGDAVVSFVPDDTGSHTVSNPLVVDPNKLEVIGTILQKTGVDHKAVQAGNQIRYRVTYGSSVGSEIIIYPASGVTYIHTGEAEAAGDGTYRYTPSKDSGELIFIAKVNDDASGYINQQISVGERSYSYLNPIAVNHGSGVFEKSSKLVISSSVEGTNLNNENAAFTFKITLTNADNAPLSGAYDYRTKYSNGRLYAYGAETTFVITVNGNDFITISDLPYNTTYSVVQVVPADYDFAVTNTTAAGKTSNTEVSNILFRNTRNETSERTLFEKNTSYILTEKLNFNDDEYMVLTKYGFSFGEKCQVKDIAMFNKSTEVWFTKTDWTDCEELPGATCVLTDEFGDIIVDELGNPLRWISGEEPKKFIGVLEAGKTYHYHEEGAPDGYGYSEDVIFTVSEDGSIDKVIMQDKPNITSFLKEDYEGVEIAGAHCELKVENKQGGLTVVDSWVSGIAPHKITGTLVVGKRYYYHEAIAPGGFSYCVDIAFTLDKNGNVVDANYIDSDGTTLLSDENDCATKIKAVKNDDETFRYEYEGNEITIENGNALSLSGEIIAKGVKINIIVVDNVIRMKDKPFQASFSKTDFAGNEMPGATCSLDKVNSDGTVATIDTWVSDNSEHVLGEELNSDTTYRYREEMAPDGYGYSETVEFTIDKDGIVTDAHYINEDNVPILFDKDGYPTDIVVHQNGTYTADGHTIVIDENGNAIDENGVIHAEGVQYEIPVTDNAIQMKDAPTQMNLIKLTEDGNPISGAKFQILSREGVPITAARDTSIASTEHSGNIREGESLIFLSNNTFVGVNITGQLTAGEKYVMRELTPPSGYIAASDVVFKIPYLNQKEPVVVTMKNKPTKTSFTKEDYAGTEIPGATCELEKVNPDGSTTSVDKWVSDGAPHEEMGILETDTTYRYHEEIAPEGYGYTEDIEFTIDSNGVITDAHYINENNEPILFDKDGYPTDIVMHPDGSYTADGHTIVIDENGNAIDENGEIHAEGVQYEIPIVDNVVQMKDAPTEVFIQKVSDTGKILSGGKFQIIAADGSDVYAIKDTLIASTEHEGTVLAGELIIFEALLNGVNITGQLKAGTDYYLRELEAPASHIVGLDEKFHVPYLNQKEPLKVPMKNTSTKASFTKEDYAGTEIPGATSVLEKVNPDGSTTPIDKWVSDGTPHEEEGILETDTTYRYHEELAPEGYGYAEDIEFTIDSSGKITDAHYINEDNEPILFDKDGYPTDIVVHPDGTYTADGHTIVIDENGNAVDENGEIHAAGVQYEIPIVDNVVQMKDAPTEVLIIKTDLNEKALDGGEFQILNPDGTPVVAIKNSKAEEDGELLFRKGEPLIFTGKENGVNITGMLKAGADFILRELESPSGYLTGKDVKFHVPYLNQKEPLKVQMKDKPTKLEVLKVDTENNPISGAKLEIRDAANWDVVDYWITDSTAHVITGLLTIGKKYVLIEAESPEGYYKADSISFTVEDSDKRIQLKMVDEPINVKLVKVRKGSEEQLSGGVFSVIRKSDNVIVIPDFELKGELTISGVLTAGETYLFHEVKAPDGYLTSGDIEFTVPVSKAVDIIKIVMEDTKKPTGGGDGGDDGTSTSPTLTLKKYDGLTMNALPGSEFTIYDSSGNVYKTITTGSEGYATVRFSTLGTYSYKETKAPDGYQLDDTLHTFEITNSSYLTEYVANYKNPPRVTISKRDSETGDAISGVRFEVIYENGEVIYTGTTDSYGQITVTLDVYGAYAVRETHVPSEYELSEDYITFTVGKGGVEGETTFFNDKKKNPILPPKNPGKKAGVIDASYDNGADGYGNGWFDRDGNWHPFATPVKTGDTFPFALLAGFMIIGSTGLVIWKKKRGEGNEKA